MTLYLTSSPFVSLVAAVPFDPKTMELVTGEIEAEVTQAMQNMLAIVEAAGGDKGSILKTTVFVKDISLFGRINTVYEQVRSLCKLRALWKEKRRRRRGAWKLTPCAHGTPSPTLPDSVPLQARSLPR